MCTSRCPWATRCPQGLCPCFRTQISKPGRARVLGAGGPRGASALRDRGAEYKDPTRGKALKMLHADISNLFILQTTVNEPAPRFWEVGGMRLESSLVGPKHWFHRPDF